jgi:PAS domain S-box-containing protein
MQPALSEIRETPLPLAPSRVWKTVSFAAICAAVICAVILFLPHGREPGVFLLGVALLALALVATLHTRFLCLTQTAVNSADGILEKQARELDAVFDGALDGILILDGHAVCCHANSAAMKLLGVRQEQLLGRSIAAFCANPEGIPVISAPSGSRRDYGQVEMMRTDGAPLFVEFTVSRDFATNRHLLVLRDLTDRQKAEEAKSRSLVLARSAIRESHALRNATLALARELHLDPVLDLLLQTLRTLVPYETAQVLLVETDSRLFLAREAIGIAENASRATNIETVDASNYPVLLAALQSSGGIVISDTRMREGWRDFPAGLSMRSWAGVPLRASDHVVGLLVVAHTLPGQFQTEHLRITGSLALSASVAIQNARLYERAEIYGAELEGRLADLHRTEREDAEGLRGAGPRIPGINTERRHAEVRGDAVDGETVGIGALAADARLPGAGDCQRRDQLQVKAFAEQEMSQ